MENHNSTLPSWPSVTAEAREHFNTHGYLVIRDALDIDADLMPVETEYAALLDRLCHQWHAAGRLASTHDDLDFSERMIRVVDEVGAEVHQHFNIGLPTRGPIRDTPIHLGPGIFGLMTSPRLLDVLEGVLGPEILSHPLQVARFKVPESRLHGDRMAMVAATKWHQDLSFLLPEADHTPMVSAWIPINDATTDNGCLLVVPGSHRHGLVTDVDPGYHLGADFEPDGDVVPLPVDRGSLLLLHPLIIHSSLPNRSSSIRWSFDLRYQPVGLPTGRPIFPGFVARSAAAPDTAVTDHRDWAATWLETRERLADRRDIIHESVRWVSEV